MRVGYIRVSTAKDEQRNSLEKQRATMEALGVDRIIKDVQSGRDTDRAGYLELLSLIEGRKVSEVIVTNLDRLGRNAAEADAAIAFAAKRGVKITALNGGEIESQTPYGFAMTRFMTTMAEMESRILAMRINDGLRKGRGMKHALRGRPPWGYALSENRKGFVPDPIEWPRAQRFLTVLESCGWRLSTALDRWDELDLGPIPLRHPRSVVCWLQNPILRGGIGYNRQKDDRYTTLVWDCHEALIPPKQFASIETLLEQNRVMWGINKDLTPKLLTSLCRCAKCNRSMVYISGRNIPSLQCKCRGCPQRYRSVHESTIADAINAKLATRSLELSTLVSEEPEEIASLRETIASLEALNDPDYDETIARKQQRLHILCNQSTPDATLVAAVRNPNFWKMYSKDELRIFYRNLVSAAYIQGPGVSEIKLKF